jgi:hypothetical protein
MVHAILVLTLAGASQAPVQDSASALSRAQQLLRESYETKLSAMTAAECTGVTFDDCMQGDWSCVDFMCPPDLAERRQALIAELERLAPAAGASEWLTGQRIALAVKNGELERAASIASGCTIAGWSCFALRGFTAHLRSPGSGFEHFDSSFALLAAEPRRLPSGEFAWGLGPDAMCVWSDPRAAAPHGLIEQAAAWACPLRNGAIERFWWLADPLWSQPGNERYIEHLARHVMVRLDIDVLRASAPAAHDEHAGLGSAQYIDLYDNYFFAFRQGLPNSRRRMNIRFRGGVATRGASPYVNGGFSFTPDAARLRDPVESTADAWAVEVQPAGCSTPWSLRAIRAGRSRRADAWLGQNERMDRCGTERMMATAEWHNLDHQTAAFRRDAWMLVASAARIPAEVGPTGILRSALALGEPETLDLTTTAAAIDADRVFRASAVIDTAGHVASIEVVGPDAVARARFGVRPQPIADGFGLSDLALVDPRFESAALAIEDALLPSLVLPRDANVGLYFEVYGIENGESLDLTLTTEKTGAGLFTRIGRLVGLAADERAVEVAWSDPGSVNARIARRFLNLDLAALDDGEQRITLTVNTADGREARVTRVVTLR